MGAGYNSSGGRCARAGEQQKRVVPPLLLLLLLLLRRIHSLSFPFLSRFFFVSFGHSAPPIRRWQERLPLLSFFLSFFLRLFPLSCRGAACSRRPTALRPTPHCLAGPFAPRAALPRLRYLYSRSDSTLRLTERLLSVFVFFPGSGKVMALCFFALCSESGAPWPGQLLPPAPTTLLQCPIGEERRGEEKTRCASCCCCCCCCCSTFRHSPLLFPPSLPLPPRTHNRGSRYPTHAPVA